jgi:hypothetical protein
MHRAISFFFLIIVRTINLFAQTDSCPHLIEWGWDMPSTKFVRDNISSMEQKPFDGVNINFYYGPAPDNSRNFARHVFKPVLMSLSDTTLQAGIQDIKSTVFTTLRHNFLDVYFSTWETDIFIDWFDDWAIYIHNMEVAAQVTKAAGLKGIIFDVEEYRAGIKEWDYDKQKYASSKTPAEYEAQARLRGKQMMEAVAAVNPDIVLLLTWGNGTRAYYDELGYTYQELLAPFIDGMLEAISALPTPGPHPKIIDGFEGSYSYKTDAQFSKARDLIKIGGRSFSDVPALYDLYLKAGMATWVDNWSSHNDCTKHEAWSATDFNCNWFSPTEFKNALFNGLKYTDPGSYRWIWTERLNWWTGENLPQEYVDALAEAKTEYYGTSGCNGCSGIRPEQKNNNSIQVYPNPATHSLTLRLNSTSGPNTIQLRNTLGKVILVKSSMGDIIQLDISSFSSGIYLLDVDTRGGRYTQKIIKW